MTPLLLAAAFRTANSSADNLTTSWWFRSMCCIIAVPGELSRLATTEETTMDWNKILREAWDKKLNKRGIDEPPGRAETIAAIRAEEPRRKPKR